jgi:GDP-L-fucose synthase
MKTVMDLSHERIVITGGTGFLGLHLQSALRQAGAKNMRALSSKDYDLRNRIECKNAVKDADIVIHLAAKVGGIGFNQEHPAEMFYDNIMMGAQLMHEAWKAGIKKFVALGTICCYPKYTPVPFKEENLWNGYPEETNAPYGLAKKMLLTQAQSYRTQYGFNAIFLLPVNLYGPGDNFDPGSSHVIPSLIKKFEDAKLKNEQTVNVWGTGRATREFLYVEDAAKAIVLATQKYNGVQPVNIGAGFEISIKDLAEKIRRIVRFKGTIIWDKTKPDGQPRRMLNTDRALKEFDFKAGTNFNIGLRNTIHWYEKNILGK